MKVVIQNQMIYPYAVGAPVSTGGSERQQWILAKGLARHGHEVVIYTYSKSSRPDRQIAGVTFRWITPPSPLLAWRHILDQEQFDWWYWRGQDYHLGPLVLLAHLYQKKVAFACASDADCIPRHALAHRKYLWPFYGLGLYFADRILIQHERQRQILPRSLTAKVRLVSSFAGDSSPVRKRDHYVAWVSVLREPKRPHLLVELARRLPGIRFVVCGAVSTFSTSSKYAETIVPLLRSCPNIDYRGMVSPDEAQRIIRHSALLLSTSSLEGFPNTFLQAWAEGVPVVSLELDPGGVINQSSLGIVTQSLEDCARKVTLLLEDEALNYSLGRNGINYVQRTHSEQVVISQILNSLTAEYAPGHQAVNGC